MIEYVKTILTGQFEAALCMLNECVRKCPPEHWECRIANDTFRQVAYHTLFFVDLYLSPGEAAFQLRAYHYRGGDERSSTAPSAGLTKDETLAYLAICRRKALEALASETPESLRRESGFSWLPVSRGELHLYNIRHVQHHTGQLSAYLRRVVEDGERWWVKTGWRQPTTKEKRMASNPDALSARGNALISQLLDALDALSGLHPGFRPAHAKGVLCSGTFTPSPEAVQLTRAPHAARPSTPVVVRFSDSSGLPTVADNDPQLASPRGIAVRFHLAEHVHTDIVAHSHDGFPVRTGEEFLEFLRAVAALVQGRPEAFGAFLASHPRARQFVEAPKPIPSSFARESFFAVTAFRFTNREGRSRHGRFRIRPEAGNDHLTAADAAAKSANFLFEELDQRLARGPIKFGITVQLAEDGDDVADATAAWPAGRPEVAFGTVVVTARADDADPEMRKIIFDPVPRVDGIDSSGDPLTEVRSAIYLLSGRRRRAAGAR